MTIPRFSALPALAALGATALLLSGCGASASPEATSPGNAVSPSAAPSASAPAPTASATTSPVTASCDTLIGADLLSELTAQGWTYKEAAITVGDQTVADSLTCTWADYTVASGNLLLFGWAPIAADEAEALASELESEGWIREEAAEGFFITEDPMQAPTTDENGYGMTYEFGNGWMTVSDTKQNLLLIERPSA